MKAARFHELGGPEALRVDEVPTPTPGPGRVIVANRAIGVNFGDLLFMRDEYLVRPRVPDTPGMEASGVVVACGEGALALQMLQKPGGKRVRTREFLQSTALPPHLA